MAGARCGATASPWLSSSGVAGEVETLIENARRGHAPSIETLLERNLSGLHAFLRLQAGGVVRAKESCADLVQSVCREVLQDIDDFEFRGEAAFRHWLFTAARRKIVDKHRFYNREKREAAREVSPAAASDAAVLATYRTFCTPSRQAIVREELAGVERAFDELRPEHREVITLSRIVGLSHKEIAERLGRSEEATRQLLARAMARLGTLLAEQ